MLISSILTSKSLLFSTLSKQAADTANVQVKVSRSKLFKAIVPTSEIRERLIKLGVERRKASREERIAAGKLISQQKIVRNQFINLTHF